MGHTGPVTESLYLIYINYKCGSGPRVGPVGYRLDGRRNRSSSAGRNKTCASPPPRLRTSNPFLGPTDPLQRLPGARSPEMKWSGREGDRLLPSSAVNKLHCHVGNSLPLAPLVNNLHQIYTLRPQLLKKCFNLIFS